MVKSGSIVLRPAAVVRSEKKCTKCLEIKPIDNFAWLNKQLNRKMSMCSLCNAARQKASYYKDLNKSRENARMRYQQDPVRASINAANFRKNNPEVMRARAARFQKNNPEVFRLNSIKRRAIKREAALFYVSKKDLSEIRTKPCIYCGSNKDVHVDHVVPLIRGGSHSIGNLAPACKKCNLQKGKKLVSEWKLWKKKVLTNAI